jgi:hypothetical protein
MHPALSKALFNEGVARLQSNPVLLVDQGWLVIKAEYPCFSLAVKHRRTGRMRVFSFTFDDWNSQPPSLRLLAAETLEELPGRLWPSGSTHWHQGGWISPGGLHTPRPFLCMRGIREYHTHNQHLGDLWSNHRDDANCSLENLVLQVAEVFQQANV